MRRRVLRRGCWIDEPPDWDGWEVVLIFPCCIALRKLFLPLYLLWEILRYCLIFFLWFGFELAIGLFFFLKLKLKSCCVSEWVNESLVGQHSDTKQSQRATTKRIYAIPSFVVQRNWCDKGFVVLSCAFRKLNSFPHPVLLSLAREKGLSG